MPKIEMYTTATCPYCLRAKALLARKGFAQDVIDEIRIDLAPERQSEMIARTGRRTVPQIFIGETHVGGCDDLIELDRQGKLDTLLAA